MADDEVPSNEKLVQHLDSEVTKLLTTSGVYDIGNYGWVSDTEPDPGYVGHAMWQTEPPAEPDWQWMFGYGPCTYNPTQLQTDITVAGEDFEGLMRLARLSIGLALLHKSVAQNHPFNDNHYFWLHRLDAVLQLNIASDRIREYLTLAFFAKSTNVYNEEKDQSKKRKYIYPFENLQYQDLKYSDKIKAVAIHMPRLATSVFGFRKKRNEIVHELATRYAKNTKSSFKRQQEALKNGDVLFCKNKIQSFQELTAKKETMTSSHVNEINQVIFELIEWYKTLAKLSSYVFEAEYWLRKSKTYAAL